MTKLELIKRPAAGMVLCAVLFGAGLLSVAGTAQADRHGGGGGGRGGGRGYSVGPTYNSWRHGATGGGSYYGGGGGYGGGHGYYGGGRGYYYGGPRYRYRPYGYGYFRPHSYLSFGFGYGYAPYYAYPTPIYVERVPVIVDPDTPYDVTNDPPSGCYYYDRFCDKSFANLDDYTAHIQAEDHAATIEIVRSDGGAPLRTLEFVRGVWRVQK